jgi:LysM repeat protein
MSVKNSFRRGDLFLLVLLFLTLATSLSAAPQKRYGYDDDTVMREMRDNIDFLRHELENQESEIKMFESRVDNQEETISSMRQQVIDSNQANKELLRNNGANWETRITAIESASKSLVSDIKQIKDHANNTAEVLTEYKQKITELEKIIALQNQNIDNLQSAVRSLTEMLQVKEGVASDSKSYRVKKGDSLEKIAKANNTTVKALKEVNNLPSDRIVEGKLLQIP